jgi:hypothetical protein
MHAKFKEEIRALFVKSIYTRISVLLVIKSS